MEEKPNPNYVTVAHHTPTKLTGTNVAATADETGAKPVATGAITFPTVHYIDAGDYYYQVTENMGLGELPMGVTATPAIYYAKVTVPPASQRTSENTLATVTYYSDKNCTVHRHQELDRQQRHGQGRGLFHRVLRAEERPALPHRRQASGGSFR